MSRLSTGIRHATGCKPPLLLDAAGCKPNPLSAIMTAIATWLGALSRSHGTWAHHKKKGGGGRAEVQEKAQGEKDVICTGQNGAHFVCRMPPDAKKKFAG